MSDDTDPIEIAWRALLDDWESGERHKAFVALAASLSRLPDAARRYRERVDEPARAERAKQGIDAVLRVAYLSLRPTPRGEHEITRKARAWLLPMSAAMVLVVFTLMAAHGLHRPAFASPWVLAGEVVLVLVVPWRRLVPRDE